MASNPADLSNLQAARSNLLVTLATEQAYVALNGPKPNYSLDGESYQWSDWEKAALEKIELYNKLIQQEKPFQYASRGRA